MTFESTPPAYSSVNDNLIYVAFDAASSGTNYKYVGELFINGVKEYTSKVFPNTNNRGVFNFGAVVREYIEVNLAPTSNGILAQELGLNKFNVSVVIKLRQEVAGVLSAVLLTDSARIFFNHYNSRIFSFTELQDYAATTASNRGLNIDLTFASANYYIPYFSETTTPFTVVIAGGTATRTKTITPTATNTLQILNISPAAINVDYAGNFTSATESYTVTVGGKIYNIKLVCSGFYTNYYLHFLNKWGGFESMLFNKVSKRSVEAEKKQFQQLPYRVSSAGVVSLKSGNILHQQNTNFAMSFKEKLKVSTDFVSDVDYLWLRQLIVSPLVYLEDAAYLYPITITENSFEVKENIVDKLTNVSIGIEFGANYQTQFR